MDTEKMKQDLGAEHSIRPVFHRTELSEDAYYRESRNRQRDF